MKNKRIKLIGFMIFTVMVLGGCSGSGQLKEVLQEEYSVAEFEEILVDYDGESIFIGQSEQDQVVIKELMDQKKKSYIAKMAISHGQLTIKEGARPLVGSIHTYLEIYLPKDFNKKISLHTTSGKIISNTDLMLSEINAQTTNGEISISGLTADDLMVTTTNGETQLESINGNIHYVSTNGNLTGRGLNGSGDFKVTANGNLDLEYFSINQDLTAYTKNGEIKLELPSGLNFKFHALSKNGEIKTNFSEQISGTECDLEGTIGDNPAVMVSLETKNGNMDVVYFNPE